MIQCNDISGIVNLDKLVKRMAGVSDADIHDLVIRIHCAHGRSIYLPGYVGLVMVSVAGRIHCMAGPDKQIIVILVHPETSSTERNVGISAVEGNRSETVPGFIVFYQAKNFGAVVFIHVCLTENNVIIVGTLVKSTETGKFIGDSPGGSQLKRCIKLLDQKTGIIFFHPDVAISICHQIGVDDTAVIDVILCVAVVTDIIGGYRKCMVFIAIDSSSKCLSLRISIRKIRILIVDKRLFIFIGIPGKIFRRIL